MTQETLAIENHHIDRQRYPNLTVNMPRKEHQKFHHKLPIDTPLAREVRQYTMLTKMIQITKNWRISYLKEFGEQVPIDVSNITKAKRQKRKQIVEMITSERKKIPIGNGLRDMLLAKILAFAHPSRFPSCRKFLHYCGYTQSAKLSKKYRRDIHATGNQITSYLIMTKDFKYYPLYKTIKQQFSKKYPDYPKIRVDKMAKNRIATLVLKEVYKSLVVERS